MRNTTAVPNPALCFELIAAAGPAKAKVRVKVVEYPPPLLTPSARAFYRPRPRHLRLTMLRPSDNDWTTGKTLSFQEERRVFLVGVVRPADTRDSVRHTVEAVLDSFKSKPDRECRPSAGVGSRRTR
jgi:hypothetical protein